MAAGPGSFNAPYNTNVGDPMGRVTPYDNYDPNQKVMFEGTMQKAGYLRDLHLSSNGNAHTMAYAHDSGFYQNFSRNAPAAAPAPAPAPAAAPAPRRSALTAAPAPAPFQQKAPTQAERDEITKPAKGLEDTIKTPPKLLSLDTLKEKRRRSYLTS